MGSKQQTCITTLITMKLHIISSVILSLLDSSLSQLKFGDSSSSSSSGSNSATNTKQTETDTRFFTGNEAIDGGILGFVGALLGGGSGSCNCGRKRRQAPGEDQPGTRFF